ncbi:MAG: glycosyltransferase family 4 protein [Chthoniobacter sp.]|nr:glycosyltransferase family 4 protein [Chthoniobacter sp.]
MNTKTPTLFILSNMRETGGAEQSIATLIPHLMERARLRVFVENDHHYDELRRHEGPRLALTRMPKGNAPRAIWGALQTLRRFWREESPSAVLANGHKGAFLLAFAGLMRFPTKAPIGIFLRDFNYYLLWLVLRVIPSALYLAPSEAVFEDARYRRWGLAAPRRLLALPNAVRLGTATPDASPAPAPLYVAACARLTRWKGLHLLISAWAQIRAAFPEATLRIYGEEVEPDYAAELRALVQQLGLGDAVQFCGYQRDLSPVFAGAAVLAVPSLSERPGPETFSRIVIEAWAHAKPVVAFAAGGPRYLIEDGADGYLVEEGNIGQLAERISKLLGDPALCQRLGGHGYAKVREQFNPEKIAGLLLKQLLPEPRA